MHRHTFTAGEKMFTKEDMFFCIVAGSCHVVQQGIGAVVDLVSKGKSFGKRFFFLLFSPCSLLVQYHEIYLHSI